MNLKKLKQAEKDFMQQYPGGFENPEMVAIGKKHKVEKMVEYVQENFQIKNFKNIELCLDHLIKVVSRSSMISVFEKPKFRDYVLSLNDKDEKKLLTGLKQVFHGNEQKGFELMLEVLVEGKLARWSIMTIAQAYFRPSEEVFVKPTTTKSIITYFELEGLTYKPRPTWEFYQEYRSQIIKMKSKVSKKLQPNNAAFCGFLMTSANGGC